MQFAGLEVHKKEVEVAIVDDAGKLIFRRRLFTQREPLEEFAGQHLAQCRVALEATTNCWALVALLQPLCAEVIVSNPLRTRAIAEAKGSEYNALPRERTPCRRNRKRPAAH